ncbi:N-acetyl sugar amidotransferase [Sediminibacterium roseum]|uniref:N-acetyl sugar amidotransferase n=1 Tax=Sediminibacterium roseum TaxID=1978412 RepID=A0ABW9ZPQ3_9BACT|nr:N-acetyl sugar amidotransferase [Sediminibacterium roseum]
MNYCRRCLYPENHPLNIVLDEKGICSGCRVHEEKAIIDWEPRKEKLGRIFDSYRSTSGKSYDCIIPVSGARDSYFIVHTVKNVYGMNPLLVTYNKHYNTDLGIRNLANLRIVFDCDIMTLTVNPETVKKITRATIRKAGSIYWHCLAGQTVYPVQVAVKFKIPLIIWGAHQGIDQVGMFSHLDEVEMTRKYRKEHDLMGIEADDLINEFDNIIEQDVIQFRYPDDKEIERIGVRGIYLNNYMRWDTKAQHEQMLGLYNYETAPQTGTFDRYNDVDCFNYSDVHDYIKYVKHGYGKITDHASREIRFGRISRDEGVELVKEYGITQPRNLPQFLEWIGITENSFHYLIDQHRNKKIWHRNEKWDWERIDGTQLRKETPDSFAIACTDKGLDFRITVPKKKSPDNKYILIGKGYVQSENL